MTKAKSLQASDMVKKCCTCELFPKCYTDEINFGIRKPDIDNLAKSLSRLAEDIRIRPIARPEFVQSTALLIRWLLRDTRKDFLCHHEVPHDIPGIAVRGDPIWSPEVSKAISRLRNEGVISVRIKKAKKEGMRK